MVNKNFAQPSLNINGKENVKVQLAVKRMTNCYFFCNYLEVNISNGNDYGIYMPLFDKFELIDVVNEKGKSIITNLITYENLNELSNKGLTKKDLRSLKAVKLLENIYSPANRNQEKLKQKIIKNIFKEDSFTHLSSKHKLYQNEIETLSDLTINTIIDSKYGNIAFIPAKCSRKLFIPINYLFQNFVVEGHRITPFYNNHGNKEEKEIFKNNYSDAWLDYEKTKTNKVKIIFKYDVSYLINNIWESNNLIIPVNYEKEDSDSILITKNYPKKLLNKFYLLSNLKSETLELNLLNY